MAEIAIVDPARRRGRQRTAEYRDFAFGFTCLDVRLVCGCVARISFCFLDLGPVNTLSIAQHTIIIAMIVERAVQLLQSHVKFIAIHCEATSMQQLGVGPLGSIQISSS